MLILGLCMKRSPYGVRTLGARGSDLHALSVCGGGRGHRLWLLPLAPPSRQAEPSLQHLSLGSKIPAVTGRRPVCVFQVWRGQNPRFHASNARLLFSGFSVSLSK